MHFSTPSISSVMLQDPSQLPRTRTTIAKGRNLISPSKARINIWKHRNRSMIPHIVLKISMHPRLIKGSKPLLRPIISVLDIPKMLRVDTISPLIKWCTVNWEMQARLDLRWIHRGWLIWGWPTLRLGIRLGGRMRVWTSPCTWLHKGITKGSWMCRDREHWGDQTSLWMMDSIKQFHMHPTSPLNSNGSSQ